MPRALLYRATRTTVPGAKPPVSGNGGGIMVNTADGRVWVRAAGGYIELKAETEAETRRVADALAAGIDIGTSR